MLAISSECEKLGDSASEPRWNPVGLLYQCFISILGSIFEQSRLAHPRTREVAERRWSGLLQTVLDAMVICSDECKNDSGICFEGYCYLILFRHQVGR